MSTNPPPTIPIPRVFSFTEVFLKDGEWDGPTPQGELLTYKSKTDPSTLRITRGTAASYHLAYGSGKTLIIFADSIHLPEGAKIATTAGV